MADALIMVTSYSHKMGVFTAASQFYKWNRLIYQEKINDFSDHYFYFTSFALKCKITGDWLVETGGTFGNQFW